VTKPNWCVECDKRLWKHSLCGHPDHHRVNRLPDGSVALEEQPKAPKTPKPAKEPQVTVVDGEIQITPELAKKLGLS
jgi:hypothetical protein